MKKKILKKKVQDIEKQKLRILSYKYFLKINGQLHNTCKFCFLNTFDESKKFIENVQLKARSSTSGLILSDNRGHHLPSNKISLDTLESAKHNILSIPTYESHYTRRDTQKRYLPSTYSLAKMYYEYKNNCDNPISRTIFEKLVHDLNIYIKAPKTDTCNTFDNLNMKISLALDEEKLLLQDTLIEHQNLADQAYSAKTQDKLESLNDHTKKTLTFDLQQCLPTPQLDINVVFYKRQLWVYNLTIHDCDDGQAYCYMWSEVDGGRGANQIASCLSKHLNNIDSRMSQITLYSDTSGGQNKNTHLVAMFMSILKNHPTLQTIHHKFLLAGHTRMECDSDHALIEKNKKKV